MTTTNPYKTAEQMLAEHREHVERNAARVDSITNPLDGTDLDVWSATDYELWDQLVIDVEELMQTGCTAEEIRRALNEAEDAWLILQTRAVGRLMRLGDALHARANAERLAKL